MGGEPPNPRQAQWHRVCELQPDMLYSPKPYGWLESIRQEPYRLLFPMGLALGAIGMGIWIPYFLLPESFPYPGQGHAAIQVQGFLLCFILGFLGTMMPKVLGIRPMGTGQFVVIPAGILAMTVLALLSMPRLAQAAHLLVLFNFIAFIARRWKSRSGSPPPPFVFIGLAMAADILGTCLRLHALPGNLGPSAWRASSLLQFQAFPLLLILGVGSFLLPKLFANPAVNPQALRAVQGGGQPLLAAMGALFIGSFAFEALGPLWLGGSSAIRLAHLIRAGVWAWFLFTRIRIHAVVFPQPAYLEGARMSLYAVAAGMILPILWPAWILAWEHVIFLGGLMWLTLSVASRVVAAHGGCIELLARNRKPTFAFGSVIVVALILRVSTDIFITSRWLHLAIAGALGLIVLGLWAWTYFPLFFRFPGQVLK